MTSRILLAGVSAITLAVAAAPARAQTTTITGGGGTLAAKVYRDIFNCYSKYSATTTSANYGIYDATISPGNPSNVTYPTAPNSVCVQASNLDVIGYEPVGSGAGLAAYTAASTAAWGSPATTNTIAYLNTTYSAVASTPYPQIQFAGSDAYLGGTQTAQQASTADGNSTDDTNAFQIPALGTPIVLPITGTATNNLTTADVCKIYSGNENKTAGGVTLSEAVVRADGSGTSFIFSDWLAQNCKSYTSLFTSANGFPSTKPSWSTVFASGTAALPIVAVSGSGGVAGEVGSPTHTGNAIAYLSPDYLPPHATVNATDSTVNSISPIVTQANVGCTAIAGSCTSIDEVYANIKSVTVPTAYDSATFGQKLNDQLTAPGQAGYPIVGFTFIDTYKCYQATIKGVTKPFGTAAQGTALLTLLETLYSTKLTSNTAQILANQGFEPLLKSSSTQDQPVYDALNAPYTSVKNVKYTGAGPFNASYGIQGAKGTVACPETPE